MKNLAVVVAISLLVLMSVAFAMPDLNKWNGTGVAMPLNFGGDGQNSTMPPCFGGQNWTMPMPPENMTWNGTQPDAPPWQNATSGTMPVPQRFGNQDAMQPAAPFGGHGMGNPTEPANLTDYAQQFLNVVLNGDYDSAKELHKQYGFGGQLFDRLNETTFAKYSQIYQLNNELREELGLNGTTGMGFAPGGFPEGPGMGFEHDQSGRHQ